MQSIDDGEILYGGVVSSTRRLVDPYPGCLKQSTHFNRGFSKLRMELLLRMNNRRNCSREVPKYFSLEFFFGGSGEHRYDFQRGAVYM